MGVKVKTTTPEDHPTVSHALLSAPPPPAMWGGYGGPSKKGRGKKGFKKVCTTAHTPWPVLPGGWIWPPVETGSLAPLVGTNIDFDKRCSSFPKDTRIRWGPVYFSASCLPPSPPTFDPFLYPRDHP